MAKNFGARKNSKYKVVSTSPSVNKTPRGLTIVNVPYDVSQDLSKSEGTSPNVFFNGDPAYVKTSHSTKVTGDKEGSHGGVKSGTVEAQSDPIEASPSVFINGKAVVRVGDKQHMQGKNTVGKVTASESGSAAHITDDGKIVGLETPPPIAKPYSSNKPTNNATSSGKLGSRTGSPVLLGSGKLLYLQRDITLPAPITITHERVYVSDGRMGMFGMGWSSVYEQQLIRSDESTLTLSYPDNRTFRFGFSDESFEDHDALGASLRTLGSGRFELYQYSNATRYVYDNSYLVKIEDRNGNVLNVIRDSRGSIERIESGETILSFSYNRYATVERVRDHSGRIWQYSYRTPKEEDKGTNPLLLESVTNPLGGIKHFEYADDLLVGVIDESERELLGVSYTSDKRVSSYAQIGKAFTYTYQRNRVIKRNDEGDVTYYAVDDFGHISAITHADGTTTKEIYENHTSTVRDEGENIHVREFDAQGRLIRCRYPQADTREEFYSYEANNPFILHCEESSGLITSHTYDARYNLTSTTYGDGKEESWSYDERGNPISHTDTAGVTTLYAYNENHQLLRSTDVMGGLTQYVYDERGYTTAIIDPNEHITGYSYNALGSITSITTNNALIATFTYDAASRLLSLTDASGNVTTYEYDTQGYLKSQVLPNGLQRIFTHDKGLLVREVREDGSRVEYTYDKASRLIAKSFGMSTIHYTYDTLGNLTSASNASNTIEYVYDTNANLRLERQGTKSVSYAYEHDGTKRFIGYEGMHYSLGRNQRGVLTSIRQGMGTYRFDYDDASRQTSHTYPNRIETRSVFDPLGRLTIRTLGEQTLLNYCYDKSSRITMRNDTLIAYDEVGQLSAYGDDHYTYDPLGNHINSSNDVHCEYNALGALVKKTSSSWISTYAYDAQGYLSQYVKTPISGVRGEHVEPWTHPTTDSGRTEIRFTYDPLGRRLTKHFKSEEQQYHHRYLYAGDNIVAIYDNDTDELLATLLHDESIDTPLSISIHSRQPLTPQEHQHYETLSESEQYLLHQSRIQTYYYHRDHQNSVIALSDKNAQIVEYYEYDAYGTIIKEEHLSDDEGKTIQTLNPYRYTGREYDSEDLYYYRARYYDPTLGRFITPDPIGFMGGDTNLYRYVGNDPVNFVDASGFLGISVQGAKNFFTKTLREILSSYQKPVTTKSPAPSNGGSSAPANKGDGAKVNGSTTPSYAISDAYFGKQATREVLAGEGSYVFAHPNNKTHTAQQKTKIAKIICPKVKSTYQGKYPTEASIKEALSKDVYNKGDSISFKLFKKEPYFARITEASIGQKVKLVALFSGLSEGKSATLSIYEKSPMLVAAGQKLMMLKDGAEVTEVTGTIKNSHISVEVELRPKKDKKENATDTSPSLELWQEKFKHTASEPEKLDHLWIHASSPASTNKEMDCLKGGNELRVKGGCQITVEQLQNIFTQASIAHLQAICNEVNSNCVKYALDTPLRRAHFFAQVYGETGSTMKPVNESWEYSPDTLKSFSRYYRTNPNEAIEDGYEKANGRITRHANQINIGKKHFLQLNGNRLDHPDDGYNFRGRGLIQLTGYEKYSKFKEEYNTYWIGTPPDIINNPDIINQFPYSIQSALWFWAFYRKAYKSATNDQDSSVVNVTKLINGGETGIDDRRRGFNLSKEVFK